jgi:hypothetical protein
MLTKEFNIQEKIWLVVNMPLCESPGGRSPTGDSQSGGWILPITLIEN